MQKIDYQELLDAGVHFGHLKRKWNPNMTPYIFMERNGIHIIDLHKTISKLEESAAAMKQIAKSGKKILFVATKKQARRIVAEKVQEINMPYVTERWPGGMLTNFATIRKAIRKMAAIDKMETDGTMLTISKKERLLISRQRAKLEKQLGSISDLTRLPAAIFIVDTVKEHIAIKEAQKLNITTFAIVDTNADPNEVDFAIPANDDASKSIEKIIEVITAAVAEGIKERKEVRERSSDNKKKAEKEVEPKAEAEKEETVEAQAEEPVAEAEVVEEPEAPAEEEKAAPKKRARKPRATKSKTEAKA